MYVLLHMNIDVLLQTLAKAYEVLKLFHLEYKRDLRSFCSKGSLKVLAQ